MTRRRKPRWVGASAPRSGEPSRPRSIRATDAEWAKWSAAAARAGLPLSEWLRGLADAASLK